ncbi:MAG: endolytic transglycosylase MltG [Deltaproteobacteria bacterium]|jgi:UPF0755 protein|nr:endolytic transglycosylase MltG [Deltaproteobacteria bacterium]
MSALKLPGSAPVNPRPKIKTGPSFFSRFIGFTGVIVLGILIAGFIKLLVYSQNFLAPETHSREVVVSIPPGASSAQIAQLLKQKGIIRSPEAFAWALKIRSLLGKPTSLKAGEQAMDPSLDVWGTIAALHKGNFKLYPFTVPEGRTMVEIAKAVEDAGLGRASDFLALCRDPEFIASLGLKGATLEGYLFPETYSFPRGTSLKAIITAMTGQFLKVWNKHGATAAMKGMSQTEVVTLASIVEKETAKPEERPLIAGVFLNRLEKGMRLQTDPTVIYGLDNFDGNLKRSHLETPHPYNTYVIDGLPPGPIASPGEESIKAVLNPAPGPFLYFVSRNDGTHHFSETLAEHNRMVNRYQRSPNRGS